MTNRTTGREAAPETDAAPVIGVAALTKMAFDGVDMSPLVQRLVARLAHDPEDAGALLDLSVVEQLFGQRENGLRLQAQALSLRRLYRRPAATESARGLRLLAVAAPGDLMANTPLDFLLEGADVTLDTLYLAPGEPLPTIPAHDLAIVAIGESDDNRALLAEAAQLMADWPRPVLNAPQRIAALSRDSACRLLNGLPGVAIPPTVRAARDALAAVGAGTRGMPSLIAGAAFPVIVRPIASHAGSGLSRITDAAALTAYLEERPESEFYLSPFIDYRSEDGLFRKYRIALIERRPYASHMAISQHWMVHYLNAGMQESVEKRAEERRFMAEFDSGFARRHAAALDAVASRLGLEYVAMDCGETPDGRLLIFEVDVAMIVHSMDPPDLFPYKGPQMRKVFAAFRRLLGDAAQRHHAAPDRAAGRENTVALG